MSSDSGLEEFVAPFITVQEVVVGPIATLSLMLVVYGMYAIIFGFCVNILFQRKTSKLGLYLACTIALFVLANIYVWSVVWGMVRQTIIYFQAAKTQDYEPLAEYLVHDNRKTVWTALTNLSGIFMNCVADIMLIHRCYVLWGSNRIFLYVLAFIAFVLNGLGIAVSIMVVIGLGEPSKRDIFIVANTIGGGWSITSAVFNGLLSLLTAGRIWWVSREARQLMGTRVNARYKTIFAAILESGILYPTTVIAAMVIVTVLDPHNYGTVPVDLSVVSTLMSGLAPTLIIVRVAHGKQVESVQQMMSINFAAREPQSGTNAATVDFPTHPDRNPSRDDIEAVQLEK
ncbi:hypothetical protein E1B28_002054 [Marasmius oreades]|uniref:Uncharacterized protein n=1 Tax=Marasmius oreades TaxID=181124 RepID=A0A9P7V4M7_9AGAR|nr:uncharacterized protein E1B28_002054 [Marasmius oreades]KAG7100281.1 hypothetical protein E1B28_002054 [Marasmius oreades]